MKHYILALMLALNAAVAWALPHEVSASSLNLRTEPSTAGAVVEALPQGATVEVVATDGEWATVSYGGRTLYASAKYLAPVAANEPAQTEAAENDFLSRLPNIDLPSMLETSSELPLYVAVALLVCFALVNLVAGGDVFFDSAGAFYAGAVGFLILCACELVYFIGYTGDCTWFCSPDRVGWLWTVINFLLFGYFIYVQVIQYINLTCAVHYHGERNCDNRVGYVATLIAIAAFIVCGFFFEKYAITVIIIDAVGLLAWLGWMVYCNVRDGGSWLNLPLAMLLWVVGVAATLVTLFHFIVMLILVLCAAIAGYVVLNMVGASSGSTSSSSSSSSSDSASEPEERKFLVGENGEEIEVEESAWSDTAREKGVAFGRKFRKDSSGKWVED